MRQHDNLPAMVSLMSQHVAQHLHAHRPGPSPAVSAKLPNAAIPAERLSQHLHATSSALGQSRTGLLRRAMSAVEQCRHSQIRSGQPDPFGSNIVHVREDRRNRASLARRPSLPRRRVEMLEKKLVHALVSGKDPDCGSTELGAALQRTCAHSFLPLDPMVRRRTAREPFSNQIQMFPFFTVGYSAANAPVSHCRELSSISA